MPPTEKGTLVLDLAAEGPLSPELVRTVNEFCDRVEDHAEKSASAAVAVVRLHGGEDGATGSWPGGDGGIRLVNRWERALRRMERLGAVTVVVLTGRCAGPALDLVLTADYRIAATGATLVPPIDAGHFWPGMALHRLVTQIGVARTRGLLLRAGELTAARSAELGLLDEVTDDIDGVPAARAREFGGVAGPEFAVRRRLVLDAPTSAFDDALGVHLAACDRALRYARRLAEPDPAPIAALTGGAR